MYEKTAKVSVCVYIYMYVCVYIHVCVCVYIYIYVCVCVCVRTNVCMHVNIEAFLNVPNKLRIKYVHTHLHFGAEISNNCVILAQRSVIIASFWRRDQ